MKHGTDSPITPASVAAALEAAGIVVPGGADTALAAHANAVIEANQRLNLTRIVEHGDVVRLHIVDSLAILKWPELLREPVLDLGSGAGYPGIPVAIAGLDAVLCESSGRKAQFLGECVSALGLTTRILNARAETLPREEGPEFGSVLARAVSSMPALVELAAPLLRPDGFLIALKGRPDESEVEAGRRAAALCGMVEYATHRYSIPGGDEARSAIVYRKVREPVLTLPRRPGLAQRRPLG